LLRSSKNQRHVPAMASRQARKNESAAQASEFDEENSHQSSQDADMLKAARDVVSTVKIPVLLFWVMFTDLEVVQKSSRDEAENHRRRFEETRYGNQCQT
jgi:hypothetical protein